MGGKLEVNLFEVPNRHGRDFDAIKLCFVLLKTPNLHLNNDYEGTSKVLPLSAVLCWD
jgi:hypothetical protein